MQRNMASSIAALRSVVSALSPDDRRRLFEIFTPLWVDLRAATPIWETAVKPASRKLLVINAGLAKDIAAEHYIQRAWSHTYEEVTILSVTAVDDGSGEGFRQAILKKYRELYIGDGQEGWDESFTNMVLQLLQRRSTELRPVYVTILYHEGISEQALRNVLVELPVAILYVNQDFTPDQCGPDTLVLQPLLSAEREQTVMLDYYTAKGAILKKVENQ